MKTFAIFVRFEVKANSEEEALEQVIENKHCVDVEDIFEIDDIDEIPNQR